ncbi:MAG: DUF4221 domain-containing protein [Tannerella sp.]|jgi:hypothetical protein|nr:DUF4221 domain-containing protein [Tannerella sp.]
MKKYSILYAIAGIILLACNTNKPSKDGLMKNSASYNYELVSTKKILSYIVDYDTEYYFSMLFPYTDQSGKEYLTFQNTSNQLLFYDLNTEDFLYKIQLEREGPNGISRPSGYYIEDLNNIYITSSMPRILYKIDSTGTVIQKIPYGKTDSGYEIISQSSWSTVYTPLVFIDSKLYLSQHPWQGNPVSKTPLCVVIDTLNQSYVLPYPFPPLIEDGELFTAPDATSFSRIFNGKEFVYSFFSDENIHVANIGHTDVRKYKIKSQYIGKIVIKNISISDMYEHAKFRYGNPLYGNLIYDPYRKLYYRFAYPGVDLENGPDYISLTALGRKKFSIIILDKNFNVVGETMFPEWVYCPSVMFVSRDGLYICNNHPMSSSFNEDILSFECFEVKKNNR